MTRRRIGCLTAALYLSVLAGCGGNAPTGPTPALPSGRLQPPSPRLSRERILAFGDSTTAGVTSARAFTTFGAGIAVSYPAKLQALINTRYSGQTVLVENAGRTGEVLEDGIPRLRAAVQSFAPDLVIILHGVNDVTLEGPRGVARNLPFITTIVRDAKQSGAAVFLCTLLPQRATGARAGDPAAISSYNSALRTLARSEDVLLIDLAATFGRLDLIGVDGLHPVDAGYDRMAALILEAIQEQFERPPSFR